MVKTTRAVVTAALYWFAHIQALPAVILDLCVLKQIFFLSCFKVLCGWCRFCFCNCFSYVILSLLLLSQLKSRLIAGKSWPKDSFKSSLGPANSSLLQVHPLAAFFGCGYACMRTVCYVCCRAAGLAKSVESRHQQRSQQKAESSRPEDLQKQPASLYLLALTGAKLFCLN